VLLKITSTWEDTLTAFLPSKKHMPRLSRPRILRHHLDVSILINQYILRFYIPDRPVFTLQLAFDLHQRVKQIQDLLLVKRTLDLSPVSDLGLERVKKVIIVELDNTHGTIASPPVPQKVV
jgi:hypothetical protein